MSSLGSPPPLQSWGRLPYPAGADLCLFAGCLWCGEAGLNESEDRHYVSLGKGGREVSPTLGPRRLGSGQKLCQDGGQGYL